MRARDLAGPYPTVSADDDAFEAARLVVRERPPAGVHDPLDDDARESMIGRSVAEWLPLSRLLTPAVVGPDASPLMIATLMAFKDTPVVTVVERDGDKATLIGAVTAAALLEHVIGGS